MEAQKLRDLMRQEKAKRNRAPPKLAVWREAGQLQCQVCKALVNSEGAWPAHLRSPQHLRMLETLRRKLDEQKRDSQKNVQLSQDNELESDSDAPDANAPVAVPSTASSSREAPQGAPASTEAPQGSLASREAPQGASSDAPVRRALSSAEESAAKKPCLVGPLPPEAFDIEQVTLAEVEEPQEDDNEKVEDTLPNGLPAGFFDDEKDEAKSKGIKNLELIKEQKLNMELRKFETVIEKEEQRMEAVRNDLDQLAFNLLSEEECALQAEYRRNLEQFRRRIDENKHLAKKEESSDSGSDVEELTVDWRAKSFGV